MRVYCKPNGVEFEQRFDEIEFTKDNRIMNYDYIIIDQKDIPQTGSLDQLRCMDGKLVVDADIKTPAMLRQQQLAQAQAALDAELGKAEPDIITVMRLQRAIEQIKKGN
jgi:hypothetical protein